MRPVRRGLVASMLAVIGVLGLATPSAQAATVINAHLSIVPNPPPGPGVFNADSVIHVLTNEYDGVGYMNNGARIELRFFADDPGGDSLLRGPLVFRKDSPGLYVNEEGIWLENQLQVLPGAFNEDDSWFNRTDEIYMNARFIDGAGATIQVNSNMQTGLY
jgi:hypothetical protein